MPTLAEQVKTAREAKGLSPSQLDAEGKFGYGFTKKVEAGTQGVGPKRLGRLGDLLGVELTPDASVTPAENGRHVARHPGESAPVPPGGLPPSEVEPERRRGLFNRFRNRGAEAPVDPTSPKPPKPRRRLFNVDPNAGRMSAADDFGDFFEWGAELVGPDHVPTSRMLQFESPIAGFMLDDAVANTVVDRLGVQPFVKARGRFDLVFAVLLPPLLTLRIENANRDFFMARRMGDEVGMAHAAASANTGMRMLRSTLRRSFPLMAPAIKKARQREKESAAALDELLDDETLAELGIQIVDGVPLDANGKKVDTGDVMLNFLFHDFTVTLPNEEVPDDGQPDAAPDATGAGNEPGGDRATPVDPGGSMDGASV